MAVGLGLLGRGGTRQALGLWALHVAGAALAGALLGGLLGGLGALAGLAAWRPWIVAGGALLAFGLRLLPAAAEAGVAASGAVDHHRLAGVVRARRHEPAGSGKQR